jgi:hypothetical protein
MTDQPSPDGLAEAERRRELLAKAREAVPLATAERYVRNSISYWDLVIMAEYDRMRKALRDTREYIESRPYSEYPLRTSTLHELMTGLADVPNGEKP